LILCKFDIPADLLSQILMKKSIFPFLSFILLSAIAFSQQPKKSTTTKPVVIYPFANRTFLPVMKKINEAMISKGIENKIPVKYPVLIYQLGWDTANNVWGDTLEKYNIVWKPDGTLSSVTFKNYGKQPDSENVFYYSDFVKTKSYLYALDNSGMNRYYGYVLNRIEQNNLQLNFIPRSVTIWRTNNLNEEISSKYIFTTDSIGNLTSETVQYADSMNNLALGDLYKFLYDSSGNLNYIKYYFTDPNNNWILNDSISYIRKYDQHGHINQMTFSDIEGTDTVNMTRQDYTLNTSGSITNAKTYAAGFGYNGWALNDSINNISWYHFDPNTFFDTYDVLFNQFTNLTTPENQILTGGPAYFAYSIYEGNEIDKFTQGFNSDGLLSHRELYSSNPNYVTSSDERYTYYPGGDFRSDIGYNWDSIHSKWYEIGGDSFVNSYNSYGDIDVSIWKSAYQDTLHSMNLYKTVYIYGATTAIEPEKSPEAKFKIYPVPASDKIYIQSDQLLMPNAVIIISDVTGRQIFSAYCTSNNEGQSIDISSLVPGLYLIRINNGSNLFCSKFIKD
jgi:hypothetical protein